MKEKYQLCNAGGIYHYIRLTKKHWWSRWEIEWEGNAPRIYMLHGVPAKLHIGENIPFEKIKQEFIDAMKDELTWEDIKRIVNIADDLLPGIDTAAILSEFQTEEAYYKEILKRYKETRK